MKNLRLFFMMPICLMACNTVSEPNAAQDREALVKQYFQHFNNHDWNKMAAMYKDSAFFKDPMLGKSAVPQTRQQIVGKYTQLDTLIQICMIVLLKPIYRAQIHHS